MSYITHQEVLTVIEIKEIDLHAMEDFLNQSTRGYHLLFDRHQVARILKTPTEEIDFFNNNRIPKIQSLMTGLISKKSLRGKRKYLESLDEKDFEILVRAYFHIVDNALVNISNIH